MPSNYEFQVYDVLQVQRPNRRTGEPTWMDFATLRTPDDAARAVEIVQTGRFEDERLPFRIKRGMETVVFER